MNWFMQRWVGDGLGMSVDVQASWHNSTVHAQRLCLTKLGKQMIVMSFHDVIVVLFT